MVNNKSKKKSGQKKSKERQHKKCDRVKKNVRCEKENDDSDLGEIFRKTFEYIKSHEDPYDRLVDMLCFEQFVIEAVEKCKDSDEKEDVLRILRENEGLGDNFYC